MFRLVYDDLDKKQVESILAKSTAPTCTSEFCSCLVGKTLSIVLDKLPVEGPTLEYSFQSNTKLSLKENGSDAVTCDYGAHSLKEITLFTHMVPGTKHGYNVIVNWKTSVVTVFEMWFIDYEGNRIDTTKTFANVVTASTLEPFLNREVQRQYYFGFFEEAGKMPPDIRDKISLRLENSVIKWDEDRGLKRLTTYTSALFSTIVELDTPDGGDTLTFASDILQINDSTFIHCFGEVEFSGRLSVEVLDLFSMKKIGTTMGIDENNLFEHVIYNGFGNYLGRFSTFYDFNDLGDKLSNSVKKRTNTSVKGARATYRPSIMTKRITQEEVTEASKTPLVFDPERAKNGDMTINVLADTDYCVGKSISFRGDDGFTVDLHIKSITDLEYRLNEESNWHSEQYRAVILDDDLIILGFYRSGSNPPASLVFAMDFKNGCTTCIALKIGSKHDIHDVDPDYHFGIIETEGLTPFRIFRHGFTNELLGRAFTWTYANTLSSIHFYNAPHSYSWTIITNDEPGSPSNRAGGFVWSSPCEYIKLRDDVYIMSFVEQKWDGMTDIFCMNLRMMRDIGFEFGISHDGKKVFMDKVGSLGRSAGKIDLSGVYPLLHYNAKS